MATATEATPAKKKGGPIGMLVMILLGLLAIAGGFSVPMFLLPQPPPKAKNAKAEPKKPALVPFGEVVVNLGEARATRFLRVKLILVVEEANEKNVTELLAKQKPFLKSWLISYLADQTLVDVTGRSGINRIRREARDQFNHMLFANGAEEIDEILFDEFVVQ